MQQRIVCTTAGLDSRVRIRCDTEVGAIYFFHRLVRYRFDTVTFFVAGSFGVASIVFKKVTVILKSIETNNSTR